MSEEIEGFIKSEIVKVQTALRMAAGLISTLPEFTHRHPQDIYDWLIDEAEAELESIDDKGALARFALKEHEFW